MKLNRTFIDTFYEPMDTHEHASMGDMNTMDTCGNLRHLQIHTDTYRHVFQGNNPYGHTDTYGFSRHFFN